MIRLRRLEIKDAPLMLEWMHSEESKSIFQNDFYHITLKQAEEFINSSFNDKNKHFAIVDDTDEYLGTISLKNIDLKNMNAEYAISIREKARGKNISKAATEMLIDYGFQELNLNRIYLCVLSTNKRAKRFYEKMNFQYEGTFKKHLKVSGEFVDLLWFGLVQGDKNECN